MRRTLALLAVALSAFAAETRDAKSIEIAESMMKAMGGADTWMKAHFVRFDFKVTAGGKEVLNRAHLWDKQTGRYRIDGKTKEGQAAVTLFNVGNQQGNAFVAGKRLSAPPAVAALKDAYGAFINDMYWLAMPFKWMDSGVNLKYLGQQPYGGKKYDVVELTFGKVGLTPGDRYQAFVSPETHLMEHWEYTLQSGQKGAWDWQYTQSGGVTLAANHTNAEGMSIHMGPVKISDAVDESLFTDPAKTLR